MTENEFTYWAFLGYSGQDNCEHRPDAPEVCCLRWGDWLHDALKTFPIPAEFTGQINARAEIIPARIDPIFQDQEEQPGNAGLSEHTRKALEQSKCLIVICSPRSAKSLYVNEAVRYFKQLGRGNRILPIVIAGEPNASDGNRSGISPDEECFVPALRHPVKPDGTLDTSRQDRRSIFADARQGDAKREILTQDQQDGEIELETAKIQLIAGLIGVGFNGLWVRERRRRFAEAQILAREARRQIKDKEARNPAPEAQNTELETQIQELRKQAQEAQSQVFAAQNQAREALDEVAEARNRAQAAESKVLETEQQVRETQTQLEVARNQVREAHDQILAMQNLPHEAESQTQAAQIQELQKEAQAAQRKILEAQNQAREALGEVAEARQRAQAAESRVLETQQQAQETQNQLEVARNQVREAQNKLLEVQNLPQDAKSQIQEAQEMARAAQSQFEEARSQVRAIESKVLEAQQQAREAQDQVAEARNQFQAAQQKIPELEDLARDAQHQMQATQQQARAAQTQVLQLENQSRDAQNQIQAAQLQARAAEAQVLELQNRACDAQSQMEAAQQQARAAQDKVRQLEDQSRDAQNQLQAAQLQARTAEAQVLELQDRARDAQGQIQAAQQQARAAQDQVQELQTQTRDAQSQLQAAQLQARAAQDQVQEIQHRSQAARRLTKVMALLAVLALLAASIAMRQRKLAIQALAKAPAVEARESGLASGTLNREQIKQALQEVGGAGLDENRRRSLEELAARIPLEEIPETLSAAAVISDARQRSHFQERLLDFWMKTNLPAAFDWSCQLTDADSRLRALEQTIPAVAADNPTNTLARLNDLKPAPGERCYALLFQRWAGANPVQAIEQREQIPGHDADAKTLSAIMTAWVDQAPDVAWNWVKAQPDSEARDQAMEFCIGEQAKMDVPKALALAESLPPGPRRTTVIAGLFKDWAGKDLEAATTACQQLPEGMAKERAWKVVLSRRIEKNPASAAEFVTNLPAGDFRQVAMADLCQRWADTDAPAVMAWASSLSSEAERIAAFDQVVANWARKDPLAASQFANAHSELSGDALGVIAGAWAQHDLPAATNWVASLPDGEKKDAVLLALASSTETNVPRLSAKFCALLTTTQPTTNLVQGLASSLAKVDVANAVEWARSLKDDTAREAAFSALSESWGQSDPKGMATYALGLPAGEAQTRYLTAACRQMAIRDLPGAMELLQQLSDAVSRQSSLEQAARSCDLLHLDPAAKYIAAMPAGDDQKAAIKGLLSVWTPADPETALNWLCAFSETNAQPESAQAVIKTWSQSEPAAVAKWLATLPAATASEPMVSAFLEGAVAKYPDYAAQWTQAVTDETKRQKYQLQVARQWLKSDPSAASKWINNLNLPEAIKQSLKG